MFKQSIQSQSGFTFIELIIYLAIVGSILTTMVLFSLRILETSNKTTSVQAVQINTRTALDIMTTKIRGAENINIGASTFGSDPGVLSLAMSDPAKNPTIFHLDNDNGTLTMTEGSNPAVPITDTNINITNMVFSNITGSNPRKNIQIEMTAAYNNPENQVQYEASQTVTTNVTVRK